MSRPDSRSEDNCSPLSSGEPSLAELCQRLCDLMRKTKNVRELEECSWDIIELCRNGGRKKVTLKSFAVKGSTDLVNLCAAVEVLRNLVISFRGLESRVLQIDIY